MAAPPSAEQVAKWKQEHGELIQLEASAGEVAVFKAPRGAVWARFRVQAGDDKKRTVSVENLVRGCLVYPPEAEFDALVERRPGLIESFGVALVEHAGLTDRVEKKVL